MDWYQFILRPLNEHLEKKPEDRKRAIALLADIIDKDSADTRANHSTIEELGEGYGDRVLEEYASELKELEAEMFGSFKPPKDVS